MLIGVGGKDLTSTFLTRLEWLVASTCRNELTFPGADVIDQYGKVIAEAGRYDRALSSADQVQFLVSPS